VRYFLSDKMNASVRIRIRRILTSTNASNFDPLRHISSRQLLGTALRYQMKRVNSHNQFVMMM